MGIPSELRDMWVSRRESFLIASPAEERKIVRTKKCTHEGVIAGFKAASVACVASAVPTLAAVRMVPWAKANLNYVAQALIISAGEADEPSFRVGNCRRFQQHSILTTVTSSIQNFLLVHL
ncbi:early nodulin-93 isoform X1 [Arachis ipaensis]|uniref:early nodulin-93 isoform X1 n=1 Tax=Arachis ipaensis TaxID=130454 RepID=UPI000A2B0CB2|nr:early nodulin-93 isoform X1 [Arachis ipaensis]XP_025659273.1 early nodulin-93 isoform X1 [Arachis hypogaea]